MAWDLPPSDGEPLSALSFLLFVDGTPQALSDVRCESPSDADVRQCDAPVPVLGAGRYTLWISARSGNSAIEGSPSAPIRVTVESADTSEIQPTSGRPRATVSSTAADEPSDLAVLPDGRVLVGERRGRIRLVEDGVMAATPLLTLPDIVTTDGQGLLALAVDPDFAVTRATYVLYSSTSGLRVTRFTMAGDTLTAPAVVLDGLPAARRHPAASMRIARDRTLYLALDDGGDRDRAVDAGHWSGKVLRFNLDGTTPRDQPTTSPVLFAGLRRPLALFWLGEPATLWVADTAPSQAPRLHRVALDARPPTGALVSMDLAADTTAVATAAGGPGSSDGGPMLLAAVGSQSPQLVRLELDRGRPVVSQRVATGIIPEPIRCMAVATDGTVYVGTARAIHRLGW